MEDFNIIDIKNIEWSNKEHSMLDCEVKFHKFEDDYIPFSATSNDIEEHSREVWNRCIRGDYGEIKEYVEPEIPQEVLIEQYKQVIQDKLDSEARKLEYDNADRVIARQNSTNPKYQAEGIAFNKWYDELWGFGTDLLNKVLAGEAEIPTLEEFEAMLPPLVIEYPEGISPLSE